MTGVIEIAQIGLVDRITELVSQIGGATAQEAKSAYDRMGVAREWAKLQVNAEELTERLAWLEAVILRRVGQLDPKCLPGVHRAAARHFATLDDEELARLFSDYPARRATTVYNLWARAQHIATSRRKGRAFGLGQRDSRMDDDEGISKTVRHAMDQKITSVREAAAVIINEYARNKLSTKVSDVVENFIDDEMPDLNFGTELEVSAFRKGLTDAVREAFTSAPVEATERSWEIPAFITVYVEETEEWMRVPSEFARVADARQMLTLRRAQVASAQRSLDELTQVFTGRFAIDRRDGDEYLRDDETALNRRMMQKQRDDETTLIPDVSAEAIRIVGLMDKDLEQS